MAMFSPEQKQQARALLSNQQVAGLVTMIGGPDKLSALLAEIRRDDQVTGLVAAAAAVVPSITIDLTAAEELFNGSAPRDTTTIGTALEEALNSGNTAVAGPLFIAFAAASGIRMAPTSLPDPG